VQLHGGFDLDLARRLRAELGDAVTVVQTLHWVVEGDADNSDEVAAQLREIAGEPAIDRVLVDSKTGGASGGSGVSFDWSAARKTLAAGGTKLIVAGGLRPENVSVAIAMLGPWGVDVASGVEASPGVKDRQKVRYFIVKARSTHV
jgi:phosphoribosylanthranilate isomerase